MPYTFPQDVNQKAGAVHATEDGNDFYVPQREMGSQALSGFGVTNVTTAGTAVQMPTAACRKVLVIARQSNTGSIFVGGTGVTSASYGAELLAGNSLELELSNVNLLYINSSVNGEGVSYIAI